MKRLKIVQRSHYQEEYERRHARYVAGRAAYDYLRRLNQQGIVSEHTWQRLSPLMERQNQVLVDAVKEIMTSDPTFEAEELDTAHREALRAQRSALMGLLRDSVISEENYAQLASEVDAALTDEGLPWYDLLRTGAISTLPITKLITAVIQKQDEDERPACPDQFGPACGSTAKRRWIPQTTKHYPADRSASGCEELVVNALRRACHGHVEFISSPLPGDILPAPEQVTVAGATVFTFDIDIFRGILTQ